MNTGRGNVEGLSYFTNGVSIIPERFQAGRINLQAWPAKSFALGSGIDQPREIYNLTITLI